MEEIKKYIESGILELYILGELTPAEKLEVEQMAAKYPAIQAELAEVENALLGYASAYSINPSEELRDKILTSLETGTKNQKKQEDQSKVVFLSKQNSFYKYAFAASVALLLISWAALFSIYSNLQHSKQQLAALQISNERFSNRVNFIEGELNDTKKALDVLRNPNFKLIKLKGTKNSPASSMMVAFNPQQKEVMIDLASMKMPSNDTGHQYQLWALVDGKPVDLGVFDLKPDSTGMKQMKSVTGAQAFAVTLEPRGGSINPTMEQMMVMGSI
ncbi:anti-sigma factor [Rubrolithibacter danxiaensis]|uniref:anti-sigma factor n=1 Tax=Rubrolithibacter danxiaensis TaxID=3390805 RepID=UPI003BF90714